MNPRCFLAVVCSLALAAPPTLLADRKTGVAQEPKPGATQDPAPSAKPKPASEGAGKIRELLDATHASQMGATAMKQMLDVFRKMPNLPDGFLDKFQEIAKPDELVDLIVPIYEKNLDARDIDAVLVFMKSDVGKRWITAQEVITKESMIVGQKWGQDLAARVMKELGR